MDEVQQRIHDLACAVDVAKAQQAEYKDRIAQGKESLAAEQREHDLTRRQLETALDDLKIKTQCADMYRDDLNDERKVNNAALKPSAKVLQQEQDDEMVTLGYENAELTQKIEALELVDVALRTDVSRLEGYRVELESSAETQGRHMQQVDAACKAAEDLWICPSVDTCNPMHKCGHREPHVHKDAGGSCNYICRLVTGICVKVTPCKECASMRDGLLNRDAVILQYESRAEDREEIIKSLAKEIKVMSYVEVTAPTTGTYTIMFSGK